MKISMENGARKVAFKISSKSNFSIFEIGNLKMENSKIVDNIVSAMDQLKDKWPGGWRNILRLYLKPMRPSKISIPLYYSKINPNDVEVPVEVGCKQSRLDKISEQLALKSKKLKLNRKTNKITKVKGEAPAKKDKNQKKIKKEESTETPEIKQENPKKKKKNSESEAVAPAPEEPQKKKKKKNSESEPAVVEAPKEGKKKKDKTAAAAVEVKSEPEVEVKTEKKKKKKQVEAVPEAPAAPEKASKKKNKKK